MTEELYLEDSYLKEFDARVVGSENGRVILDRTVFFPRSGGLEGDRGILFWDNGEAHVTHARKEEGEIVHYVDGDVPEGVRVKGVLDWENRYRQMRLHTASHIVSALFYEKYGALVTGGHITAEKAKEMYNVDKITDEMIDEVFREANEIVKRGIEVKIYWLPREEALKIEGIVKLAGRTPPDVEKWRIVEIPGVDIQADGGPHVRNTREIGEIAFLKKENKGKGKKVVAFTVKP